MRGVGDAGLFGDGEGVHVAADEEGGAGAVFEQADDAEGVGAIRVEADVVGYGVAGFAEGVGEESGGLLLVVGELGVGVELLVDGDERRKLLRFRGGEILCGHMGCKEEWQHEDEELLQGRHLFNFGGWTEFTRTTSGWDGRGA